MYPIYIISLHTYYVLYITLCTAIQDYIQLYTAIHSYTEPYKAIHTYYPSLRSHYIRYKVSFVQDLEFDICNYRGVLITVLKR